MSKLFSSTGVARASPSKGSSLQAGAGLHTTPIVSLLSLEDSSSATRSIVPLTTPLFQPQPNIIRFTAYEPFRPVTATLLLTNQDHVSRRVKLEAPKDHHFRILSATRPGLTATRPLGRTGKMSQSIGSSTAGVIGEEKEATVDEMGSSKIAPGMAVLYTIQFTPRDRSDYSCDLVCTTEREQFLIPIRAQGDRPSIDLPASLDFGVCPVRHPSVRPVLVRNDGPVPAQFTFAVVRDSATASDSDPTVDATEPPPFTVEPTHGRLGVDESIQVLVSFAPNAHGPINYRLVADLSADGASDAVAGAVDEASDDAAQQQQQRFGTSLSATGSSFAALSGPITPLGLGVGALTATSSAAALGVSTIGTALSPAASRGNVLISMSLTGDGRDVDVDLSLTSLVADATYVGLRSQKTVLLRNHSDIPIAFAVRRLPSRVADAEDRRARAAALRAEEAYERAHLDEVLERIKEDEAETKAAARATRTRERVKARHEARRAATEAAGYEFDSSDEEQDAVSDEESEVGDNDADPDEQAAIDLLRAEQWIVRKFQRLHRALDSDALAAFEHANYAFDPLDGEIWPRGTKELTLTFAPDAAGAIDAVAYIEVTGRLNRIPLRLSGQGLGAEARFSYTTMDIGSVYMNAPHRYEVTLQNIGNIPARWRLRPERGLGGQGIGRDQSRFKFSPSEGVLAVTPGALVGDDDDELGVTSASSSARGLLDAPDRVTIQVDFLSSHIGEFVETLVFELVGNQTPLTLVYKGEVVGPTFHFDEEYLDYGRIAYGFLNSRVLHLHNTSAIEMKVRLHIDEDGEFIDREFGMILASNKLEDAAGNPIDDPADDDAWSFEPKKNDPINLTATSGNVATIPAFHHAQIQVDLISESANKRYDDPTAPYRLLVDVEGVGESVVTIPIRATCLVSVPSVVKDHLAYETVFLRHTYEQSVPLRNDTDLPAKFEVLPQDEHSKSTATIEPEVLSASIAPHSTYMLKMRLTPHRLGAFQQPFYIQIPGSDGIPFVLHASFNCRGPRVLLDAKSVVFGSVSALTPVVKVLTLHNDSPIPARFKAFVHKKSSCYTVDINRGTIAPFARQPLRITAFLDETLTMADQLHVLIDEGEDLTVPLRATGTGTTVASTLTADTTVVDFGDQLTNTHIVREFRLENRGRRTQILQWEYVPDMPPVHNRMASLTSTSGGAGATSGSIVSGGDRSPERTVNPLEVLGRLARMKKLGNEEELASLTQAIFSITPNKITLEPNTAMVFTLAGTASRAGQVDERWICKALVGQAKKLEVIYDTRVRANFLTPFLAFNTPSLAFTQVVDPKVPLALAEPQPLIMTNKTPLTMRFRLKVPPPFVASVNEFALDAGASAETLVRFVPEIGSGDSASGPPSIYNRTSVKVKQDLTVIYSDHPQRDRLALLGDLCYPNLSFSTTKVDFGSILNETSKRVLLTITNHSAIESTYQWFFAEHGALGSKSEVTSRSSSSSSRRGTPTSGRRGTPNPTLKMGTDASSLPMNELFDILPIRGSLLPGESETVEVTFYGHQELKVGGTALCCVDGGPEYEVQLKGEASSVSYSLDCTQIQFGPHDVDFGPQDIFATTWKEVQLSNDGRVAFDFKTVEPEEGHQLPLIECQPPVGKLKAGEKIKLQVRFLSARPDTLEGVLQLQVACFDPVPIHLSAAGILPQLAVDLPTASEWLAERGPDAPPAPALDASAAFSVSRYVADLGPIIKNTVGEMTFTIRNVGPVFASYTLDKKQFQSSIFTVEPTMVTRVPPGQETTFTVVCRASNPTRNRIQKKDIFEGQELMLLAVPIQVRNGPPLLLHLCAHVTVPDVLVSHTKLDFGSVVLNQRREMTVQLHNDRVVPATWSFSHPIGSNVRDKDCFELRPFSGTLAPGEKVNVTVAYTPSLLEERKSTVRIPLKVERNPKLINLMATGSGVSTLLSFDPPLLRLANTLPYAPTAPTPFRLVNHSDRALEVYSLDYDRAFEREEAILAGDEGFDDPAHPDLMFLPPRAPGDPLPTEIMQRYKLRVKRAKRLEEEARLRDDPNAAEVGALLSDAALVADATGISGLPLARSSTNADEFDDLSSELVRNLLVVGAPFAGKTTTSRALLPKLDLRSHQVCTVDAAVRYFYELTDKDQEEAETLGLREKEYQKEYEKATKRLAKEKRSGAPLSPDELHAAVVVEIGAVDLRSALQVTPEERALAAQVLSAIDGTRARLAAEAQEAALAAKTAKKAAASPTKAAKQPPTPGGAVAPDSGRTSPSPRLAASARGRTGSKAALAPPPSGLFEPDADLQEYLLAQTFFDLRSQSAVLSEEVLAEALYRYVLIQRGETFRQGIVVDGLDSCFADPTTVARVVRTAFARLGESDAAGVATAPSRDNSLHIVALDLARADAAARMQASRVRAKALLEDEALAATLKRFKVLSPRDIDKLTDAKRQEYERTLDLFTKRREAEVALYQIDHIDPQRFDAYWGARPTTPSVAEALGQSLSAKIAASTSSSSSVPFVPASLVVEDEDDAPASSSAAAVSDPLADILSSLDLPSFLPATEMPPVLLPEEVETILSDEERAAAEEAERVRLEALAAEEAAAAKAKEEEEAAAKKGKKGSSAASKKTSPLTSRASSTDGRKPPPSGDVVSSDSSATVPSHLQPSSLDGVPVRVSSMSGLPSLKYLKIRRFDSDANVARLVNTTLPWIEEIFRTEVDPRSLDPNWIPPPVTWQIVPRPGLRPRRHVKTQGFVIVDPAIEEEIRVARLAAEAAEAKRAAEEAAALAEEEGGRNKRSRAGKSASRRSIDVPADAGTITAAPPAETTIVQPVRHVATRWQIPPHSSQVVYVSFTATHVGSFASRLGFEYVGGTHELELGVESTCAVPEIASDPRSIFMKKSKTSKVGGPLLARTYVQNEKIYDFGPILVGKDPETRHQSVTTPIAAPSNGLINNDASNPINLDGLTLVPVASKKSNADVWRITNSGPFATHIDLSFLHAVDSHAHRQPLTPDARKGRARKGGATTPTADRSPSPAATAAAARKQLEEASAKDKKLKKPAGGLSEKDLKALEKAREAERAAEEARWEALRSKRVFLVEPCSFDLGIDESRDITVWAFPQTCGTFCDTLVATIRDNPSPVQLPLRVTGAKPTVTLSTNDVTFDRLLLAREERRTVDIVNTGTLPVAWSIAGLDQLPAGDVLAIGPVTRGILPAGAPPLTLTIDFAAREEKAFNIPLHVEVRDVECFLGVLETHPLTIKCESYQNKAHLDFGTTSTGAISEVQFDLARVGDVAERAFSLVNEGLYEVRYQFVVPSASRAAAFDRIFYLTPNSGVLAAHHRQEVVLQMKSDREFAWTRDTSMKLLLFESDAETPTKKFDVPITAAATFSKYHLLPATAVQFGPVETGTPTTKTIVLHNDGAFDFEYRFYARQASHAYSRVSVLARSDERDRAESEKGAKGASKKKDAGPTSRLGSTPKAPVATTRPVAPAPVALAGAGKPGKDDKKKSNATPRVNDKTPTPLQSSRLNSASSLERKASSGVGGMGTPKGMMSGKKAKAGEVVLYDQPPEIELGPFTLHDPCGFVRAGTSIELEVTFYSESPHAAFNEGLELEISGAEPSAAITPYDLLAESCTPGIETRDSRSIFEEQEVRKDLARSIPSAVRTAAASSDVFASGLDHLLASPKDFFAEKERIFSFAPVIVNQPASGALTATTAAQANPLTRAASPSSNTPNGPRSRVGTPERSRSKKSLAIVEPVRDETLPPVVGRVARFRIANPYKVPAQVTLHMHTSPPPPPVILSPAAVREAKEGKKGAKATTPAQPKKTLSSKDKALADAPPPFSAFTLAEQALVIPPGEHRYVSVTFRPEAPQTYNAWFEALVETGLDVATRSLLFELRGDGALPTVSVVAPTTRDEEGRPLIDFHRLFHDAGSSAVRTVTLRNDGLVPATARFDLLVRAPGSNVLQIIPSTTRSFFGFSGRGQLVTLAPGESASFDASFTPVGVGAYAGELRMAVVSNPYGGVTFAMRGESFLQDVTVEAAGLETVALVQPTAATTAVAGGDDAKEKPDRVSSGGRGGKEVIDLPVSLPLVQHLAFADAAISTTVSHVLTLVNHSDSPYRFAWTPPPPPNSLDATSSKRGGKKDASGSSSGAGGSSSSKKKDREAEEERRRVEEEAKRRSQDGSAAAAQALALALAAAAAESTDPTAPDFVFTPSIGHLAPHASKNITVTFRSGVVRQYVHALASCQLQRIRYLSPEAAASVKVEKRAGSAEKRSKKAAAAAAAASVEEEKTPEADPFVPENTEWDNAQTVVRWISESEARERAEAAAQARETKSKTLTKNGSRSSIKASPKNASVTDDANLVQVTDTAPEPAYELIDPPQTEPSKRTAAGGESSRSKERTLASAGTTGGSTITSGIDLRLSAVADVSRFELALASNKVHFRPTFMYQTRVFTFVLANPASTRLAYSWLVDRISFAAAEDVEEPFTVTPAVGVIPPRQSQTFTIRFSPLASRDYRTTLRALIPDLNANQDAPVIELRGTSLRPKCHFELPPSDYLTVPRRPAHFHTAVEAATRVLEFKSLGVRIKNLRKFYVVNPTDVSYAFHWKNEDAEVAAAAAEAAAAEAAAAVALTVDTDAAATSSPPSPVVRPSSASLLTPRTSALALRSPFKCLTPKGVIESGRKFEMIFEYTPTIDVASESRWRFVIPNLESQEEQAMNATLTPQPTTRLDVPFLLAGAVAQPWLELDRTFLNFNALLVGQKRTETIYLTNAENVPFQWSVDRASLPSLPEEVLSIVPTSGVVTPNSRFAIAVTLRPNTETRYNFNVSFVVKSKPTKLSVNIKAEGYELRTDLAVVDGDEEAERERRRVTIAEREAREAAEAAASAAAAALAEQGTKGGRGSAGKSRKVDAKTAAAANAATSSVIFPPVAGASGAPISPSSAQQGPPAPVIPLGGIIDLEPLGFDLDAARVLAPLTAATSSSLLVSASNRLDFGTWPVHERRVRHLLLRNTGQFHVDFKVQLPSNRLFRMSPSAGQIQSGHTVVIDVIGGSREEQQASHLRANIFVGGIKKYAVTISGATNKPNRFAMLH